MGIPFPIPTVRTKSWILAIWLHMNVFAAERLRLIGSCFATIKTQEDGKFPTMKDLRAEKEQLTIQKDAQYDTYHYFKDYHKELQTVCANVDSILGAEQEVQQHEQQHTRKYEPSL